MQTQVQEHAVEIDGQIVPVDSRTAATDESIRQALRGFYPEIANATITRRTEGTRELISIVKRAGPKGASDEGADVRRVLARLRAIPTTENPAIQLARELDEAPDAHESPETRRRIEDAVITCEQEARATARALMLLNAQQPTRSRSVPAGF